MSSIIRLIDKLIETADKDDDETSRLARDINYIRKSSSLISDALQKGFDVMQTADGDIVITEIKTITYRYHWQRASHKFERITSGNRSEKRKIIGKAHHDEYQDNDVAETAFKIDAENGLAAPKKKRGRKKKVVPEVVAEKEAQAEEVNA